MTTKQKLEAIESMAKFSNVNLNSLSKTAADKVSNNKKTDKLLDEIIEKMDELQFIILDQVK